MFLHNNLDVILIFDVFHLLNRAERNKLLKEVYWLLKKGGFLSYYVTHIGSYDIDLDEVHMQMVESHFTLKEKFQKPMVHWGSIEDGLIFNYYKI